MYLSLPVTYTEPSRLAAVAAFYGIETPAIERARILDAVVGMDEQMEGSDRERGGIKGQQSAPPAVASGARDRLRPDRAALILARCRVDS